MLLIKRFQCSVLVTIFVGALMGLSASVWAQAELLSNPGPQSFDEEQEYFVDISARPGARIFVSGMPPGMRWDEVNRRFDFRPDFIQGGKSWQITMEAVDGTETETQVFEVTVNNTIQPPWPEVVGEPEILAGVLKYAVRQVTDNFLDSPGHAGREFAANLAIPTAASSNNPLPVRIGLHGFGGGPGTVGRAGFFGIAPHDANNTWWTGYSDQLPDGAINVGTIPNYTQRRVMHLLSYLTESCPGMDGGCPGADPEGVSVLGQSMGGTGSFFLAINYGYHLAGVGSRIGATSPHFLSPGGMDGLIRNHWGAINLGLPGGNGINVWELYDSSRAALNNRHFRNLHFSAINGKLDFTIPFTSMVGLSPVTDRAFLATLQSEGIGHFIVWDQRTHSTPEGAPLGANWWNPLNEISFLRRNLAFPAFSNCSADEDAGEVDAQGGFTGALRGTKNRYLQWDSANISDTRDQLSMPIRVDINTTGTPPDPEFPPRGNNYFGPLPITADVTMRRIQRFQMLPGETIHWSYDGNSGTVFANVDGSVTVPNLAMTTSFAPLVLSRLSGPVSPAPALPSIVTQPEAVTVTEGEGASFSVVAAGSGPLTYQWFRDGSEVVGATSASFVLTTASLSDNGAVYRCNINNNTGSVSSRGAVLTVLPPPPPLDVVAPMITLSGANPQTITVGGAYTELGATATDNVDGNISSAISINTSAVNTATAGSYNVTYNVSDAAGNLANEMIRSVTVTAATVDEPADESSGGGGALGPMLGLGLVLLALRRRRPSLALSADEGRRILMRNSSYMSTIKVTKHFFLAWTVFGVLVTLTMTEPASAAQDPAQFANINYDVVYVRCPRGKEPVSRNGTEDLLNWNGVNDLWLSAANNIYHQPGCDLVLHRSNMSPGDPDAEEVLVDCDEDDSSNPVCSVTDPNVSFDGRYVVYTKFTDTRTFLSDLGSKGISSAGRQTFMRLDPNGNIDGNRFAGSHPTNFKPYANPALVFIYDLQTNVETQVSPDSKLFAGRAHPAKDPEWTSNIPVMDTGPFFMADGRIGFTSNREQGFAMFQLFAMDRDGRNMEVLSHRAMANQLHPAILTDGRIVYTNVDRMLQRTSNNNFSLFEINPDGSAPFIFAGKNDPTIWSYHYFTQLSDGDIVVTLYYNQQQTGLGALARFPADPPGPDFVHSAISNGVAGDELAMLPDTWRTGNSLLPFARPGQFRLTPNAGAGDNQMPPYDPSEYFEHPVDGRTVTMNGRFSHPAAAPDNDLLTTYTIGGSSTQPAEAFRQSLEATMNIIGKDAGIWLLPLEPNSTRQIGHIADDARIVVDFPQYHEIMPRAVVSYQDIYGIASPDPDNNRRPTSNDGTQDQRLPAGAPYGLTGAASMYDRETRSLNGTPWNMRDGGGAMSGRTYMNLAVSGSELAIFDNDEIFGVRVLMPVPRVPEDLEPYIRAEGWSGFQRHHLRILGEYPVRKPDGNGVEPADDQGNPDTSFMLRVPADTPFLMQTIDKQGMALDIETTSRSVARGEQQLCAGCHVHTRTGMDPVVSRAKTNVNEFGDFTGSSAPLFVGEDASGFPIVASAQATYAGEAGVAARRSFAVDWDNNIAPIVESRCASCHAEGQSAQQLTGLRLDSDNRTYDLIIRNQYTREDGVVVNAGSKPGNGLTDIDLAGTDRITQRFQCCTPSRWVSVNSARSSMLAWALYGERLDGRDPATGLPATGSGVVVDTNGNEFPEIWPKVAEHLAYLSDMPEAEKRLITRWLDIGAPKLNVHDDKMRPVMTLSPVGSTTTVSSILVGLWDDSALDFSRFRVTANGVDITPEVTGTPEVVTVPLPTAVTDANADSFEVTLEIWDLPDRSWSRTRPGEAAANRTRRSVTGHALLRMAGGTTGSVPPPPSPPPPSDDVAPVITLTGANPQTITVGGTYTELGATANDNVDGNISAAVTINASAVNMTTAGSYSVTYNVSDAAGNAANEMRRTVTVNAVTVNEPADDSSGGGGAFGLLLLSGLLLPAIRRRYQPEVLNSVCLRSNRGILL